MASTQPFALQPIIGMKAEAPELTSDFDDIFSSDGDEQPISIPNPGLSTITHVAKKTNKVTSLIDVAPQLTNLSTLLNDYKFPEKYEGKIDFVPENTAPEDLVTAINSTYESNSYQPLSDFLVHFNIQSLNDTQLCQLRIVQHIYDKEIDLESLISNESDSRVLALLYFALSIDKEPEVEAAFCLNSALEFAKSSSVIPISLFFPNFDLKYITVRICTLLSSLFSKNPLMPSAIGKLSPYVDPKLMEKLTEVVDDSDSDDDFSDSFLEDIQVQRAAAPLFQIDFNQCITNPLDLSMRQISPPCIVLPQAPTTFTFLLANGEESIYGIHFSNWLKDCSSRSDPIESDTGSLISYSEETTNSLPPIHLDQVPSLEKNYDDIYGFFNNPGEKVTIPDDPDFALSLPILHYINSRSDIPCPDSFGESRFFSLEFSAHKSFEKGDSSLYLDTLEKLIKIIPTDIPQSAIRPLNPKRKFPTNSNSDELNEDTKIFMALIDAFLMIEMRSPLTLLQYSFAPKLTDQSHPIFNREWRTKALYHLYITNTYFPYLSFRAAFTIANSLIDTNPEYASRLGFEALYLLLHPFPNLKTTIWCRSTYFLLGESLESVGKYYYCALCHDCALPLTIRSRKMTSKAAQIAHKNHDSIRTVFYYLEALKLFTQSDQNDEALYGTQVLAGIYRENVQYLEGIKLINTILNGMKPKTTKYC
ncbi:hypothetical protein GPJ56_001732 [Histomonas meleagridis]|uniref:uncharacterized protein n=1 Tax=Histomonas meleagridis TaxID=135588 RepID=UPI00355AB810|nr:hypothetical protein GPJ56_001732 [Histomonas meleagridis]KAH0796183.1 hypothetical protein GO595_010076 [Histomonas meleagridis]